MNINNKTELDSEDTSFISLAKAAKMTGYHQDYLGQLARSGRLDAQKIGRNWVTTKRAIDIFLGRIDELAPVQKMEQSQPAEVSVVQNEIVETEIAESVVAEPVVVAMTQEIEKVSVEPTQQVTIEKIEEAVKLSVQEIPVQPKVEVKSVTKKVIEKPEEKVFVPSKSFGQNFSKPRPDLQGAIIGAISPHTKNFTTKKYLISNFNKLCQTKIQTVQKTEWRKTEFRPVTSYVEEVEEMEVEKVAAKAQPVRINKFAYRVNVALFSLTILAFAGFIGFNFFNLKNSNKQTPETQVQTSELNPGTEQEIGDEPEIAGASTATVGQGTVPAFNDEILVRNDSVGADSTILVNFRDEYAGHYWIASQSVGQFVLKVSERPQTDLPFDYAILGGD